MTTPMGATLSGEPVRAIPRTRVGLPSVDRSPTPGREGDPCVHPDHPGQVHPAAGLQAVLDRWPEEPGPADGWLWRHLRLPPTTTCSSPWSASRTGEAAMREPERPEQVRGRRDAWASTGRSSSTTATDVTLLFDGGSDDAGFVQVIRGKVDDPARLRPDRLGPDQPAPDGRRSSARPGARARRHLHRDDRVSPTRPAPGGASSSRPRRTCGAEPPTRYRARTVLRPAPSVDRGDRGQAIPSMVVRIAGFGCWTSQQRPRPTRGWGAGLPGRVVRRNFG